MKYKIILFTFLLPSLLVSKQEREEYVFNNIELSNKIYELLEKGEIDKSFKLIRNSQAKFEYYDYAQLILKPYIVLIKKNNYTRLYFELKNEKKYLDNKMLGHLYYEIIYLIEIDENEDIVKDLCEEALSISCFNIIFNQINITQELIGLLNWMQNKDKWQFNEKNLEEVILFFIDNIKSRDYTKLIKYKSSIFTKSRYGTDDVSNISKEELISLFEEKFKNCDIISHKTKEPGSALDMGQFDGSKLGRRLN